MLSSGTGLAVDGLKISGFQTEQCQHFALTLSC